MYPIPATRNLSLLEISEHWSAEIYPPRSRQKLLDDLTKAWWRGELKSARGLPHVKVLRAFCNIYDSQLVFPGSKEPQILGELPDGNYGYLFPISLPNAQSDSWDDTNCKQAFDDVAAIWGLTAFDTIALSSQALN